MGAVIIIRLALQISWELAPWSPHVRSEVSFLRSKSVPQQSGPVTDFPQWHR